MLGGGCLETIVIRIVIVAICRNNNSDNNSNNAQDRFGILRCRLQLWG